MQNWQKDRNYRKFINPEDGSETYIITVDGVNVEVTEKVFAAYSKTDRRERYCAERDAGRLFSLDLMNDNIISEFLTSESAEDILFQKIFSEQLYSAFSSLTLEEQRLIKSTIIDGVSERDYAKQIGLSQKGVNKRKHKILEKLKKSVLNE